MEDRTRRQCQRDQRPPEPPHGEAQRIDAILRELLAQYETRFPRLRLTAAAAAVAAAS